MRLWPFGGKDKGADDLARDRDEQFEDETEDGFEGDDANDDEEQVDDLSDLDAEVKARVDKALAAKETAFAATLRARDDALGELGMGFMSDGRPAIRDPQKVAAWAGAPAREAPAAPKAQAEEEEEEEIDVYDLDGKKLSQIVDRRAAKLLEKRLAQYEERFQQQDQLLRGYEARDAVGRAQDAIRQSVPHLADFIDHPDFAESFRRVAATVSPQQLQDPTVLVMLAGSAVTKGRFAPDQAMQSTLSRRGLASVAPSREGGTGQATKAQDEEERLALSRFMGYEVSADRFAAAKHDNYDDWKAARTAAAKKR
jgi:hypothetical protein